MLLFQVPSYLFGSVGFATARHSAHDYQGHWLLLAYKRNYNNMSAQLFKLIAQNDSKISELIDCLRNQVRCYKQGFVGNKQQESFSIIEDNLEFKQKMNEFKNQSDKFVDSLGQIKKNSLIILENFPTQEIWLNNPNDRQWSNFIDQFVPKGGRQRN